jgi:hypothetical protein
VEQAIISLDPRNITDVPVPPIPQQVTLPPLVVTVTQVAIERDLRTSGEYVSACPTKFSVTDADGTFTSADYAKKYPDKTLRFNYFWYERYNDKYYVRNPAYEKNHDPAELYIGVVMNNVITTDGKNIGRAAVRVKATHLTATHGAAFREIVEADGRVKPENVLYHVEKRDEPMVDNLLYSNLDKVCYVVPATMKDVADNIAALATSGGGDPANGSKDLKLKSPAASSVSKYGSASHAALLVTPALLPASLAAQTSK